MDYFFKNKKIREGKAGDKMEKKSKTQKKNEVKALQELGEQLVALSRDQILSLEIPEELKQAAVKTLSMTKFGAIKRQLQYIGVLMRDLDPGPIKEALERRNLGRTMATQAFKEMETWRDKLLVGDNKNVEIFLAEYPAAQRQQLKTLIRSAARDAKINKKEKINNPVKASYRNLFKYIRTCMEAQKTQKAQEILEKALETPKAKAETPKAKTRGTRKA